MKRMKHTTAFLCAVFAAASVNAQVLKSPTVEQYRKMVLAAVKQSVGGATAGKGTATDQRLIAFSTYQIQPTGGLQDTASFVYSGVRKSNYNKSEMDFLMFDYDPTFNPMIDLSPVVPAMDELQNKFDSAKYYVYDSSTQSLTHYFNNYVTYNANGKPAVFTNIEDPGGSNIQSKIISFYDNGGKLVRVAIVSDQNGTWDTTMNRYFVYDAQGRATHDSSTISFNGMPMDFLKYEYTYDASGKVAAFRSWIGFIGSWEESAKIEFNWNSQNRISSVTTKQADNGSYIVVGYDSLGYNTAGDIITYRLTRELDSTGVLMHKSYQTLHLNAAGLPDTGYIYAFVNNAWILETKNTALYNSFENPEWVKSEYYPADGGQTMVSRKNYYYETFNDNPTDVNDLPEKKEISLYPNPASGSVTVAWDATTAAKATVQVYGLNGQLLSQEAGLTGGRKTINITALPAGQYMLILRDEKGVLINRQSFIKM